MVQIIPTVLATSGQQYQNDISRFASSESLRGGWIHIDLADNKFVPNRSINPKVIGKFPIPFQKEAHLMVTHPKEWIDKLVEVGFKRVIFHIEAEDDIDELIGYIREKRLEVGLAIKNETPIDQLEPYSSKIDVILVMSIVPGFQGQPFIPESFDKIRQIRSKNWPVKIGVDGAVKDTNAKELIDAGVDFMIVGSYLLEGDIDEKLEQLWEAING